MTNNGLLNFLDGVPYGAFAVDMSKTILFWNRGAEQILERRADEAIGRTCCEVLFEITQDGNGPLCAEGCPSVAFVQQGHVPGILSIDVLTGSDERKPITLTPLIVPEDVAGLRLLVLLFHELGDAERAGRIAAAVGEVLTAGRSTPSSIGPADDESTPKTDPLTNRELEILRLIALGLDHEEISAQLGVSSYTVLNHIRSLRSKLEARDKLGAVLAGLRHGLL